MSNRAILVFVGSLFSIYCLVIATLTFIGLNFAAFHLSSLLLAGFAAIYAVLSPIGLSGILGGLHRKRNLIRGFMFQYWFATLLMIGVSVANVLFSSELRNGAIQRCQSALFGTDPNQDTASFCASKVQRSEGVALIAASVQGAVLILFGIIVLLCGVKEFKDILLEEETKKLLEKAKFQEGSRNSFSDTESNISGSTNFSNSSTVFSDSGRSLKSTRSDKGRFAQNITTVPTSYGGQNRSLTSQNSTSRAPYSAQGIGVTTKKGTPPGHYQSPPGHYQPAPPKNYSSPDKNNYPPPSNKNNYPPPSNKNNYPPSKKNNYPPPNKNYGPSRSGQKPQNSKPNNYSSQQLPLESHHYLSPLPEQSFTIDRYGAKTSQPSIPTSYSQPLINFAGKSKSSMTISSRNYPPNTRQPAMMNKPPANINRNPSAVSADRPQQQRVRKVKKDYQASGNDYADDYNDYTIQSNSYNIRPPGAKTHAPNLTRGGLTGEIYYQ